MFKSWKSARGRICCIRRYLFFETSLNIAVYVLDTRPKLAQIVFFGSKTIYDGRNNVSYDFSSIFISLPSLWMKKGIEKGSKC